MAVRNVAHPSVDDRIATGGQARERVPPSGHAGWVPAADRPDPVALLEEQNLTREKDLVPVRHGRMMVSPFTFYRGAAKIMAADLKDTPVAGLDAQLCGDAHLDEDELKASIRSTVGGTARGEKAAKKAARLEKAPKKQGKRAEKQDKTARKEGKRAEKTLEKAHTRDSLQALSKLGELVDGRYRIVSQPPIVVPARDLAATYGLSPSEAGRAIRDQFRAYRATLPDDRRQLLERFEVVDMARKVVGVGSVGTRAFIVLLQGRDAQDPLFLQVKEATASVLEANLRKSRYRRHGERVVQGQRMMQAASDIYLGWTKGQDVRRQFYWRQLRDMKGSALVEHRSPPQCGSAGGATSSYDHGRASHDERARSRRGRQCATTGQSDRADRAPRQQHPNDQVAEGRWQCPCLEPHCPPLIGLSTLDAVVSSRQLARNI